MQDLNHALTASGINSNWSLVSLTAALSAFSATQKAPSASVPSFNDTLSSFQQDDTPVQNETEGSASTMLKQFQSETSLRSGSTSGPAPGSTADRSDHAGNNPDPGPSSKALNRQRSVPSDTTAAAGKPSANDADVYVAQNQNAKPVPAIDIHQAVPAVSDADGSGGVPLVPSSKPKQSKDVLDRLAAASGESKIIPQTTPSPMPVNPVISNPAAPAAPLGRQANDPATTIASNVQSAGKGKNTNDGLAFAVKIEGVRSTGNNSPLPASNALLSADTAGGSSPFVAELSAMSASFGGTGGGSPGSEAKGGDGQSPGSGSIAPAAAAAGLSPGPEEADLSTDVKSEVSQEDISKAVDAPEDKAATLPQLKTVQVQVTGPDSQRVDLKLMEKSGALTISVRTADASLTKSLQDHLPELSGKLDNQPLRTEWWTPGTQKLEPSQKSETLPNQDRNNNSGTQDQNGQGKGDSGQQSGRNTRQPDWLEELSDLRKSNQNGAKYEWQL